MRYDSVDYLPREQVEKMIARALLYDGAPFTNKEGAMSEASLMLALFAKDLDWYEVDVKVRGRKNARRYTPLDVDGIGE